MTSDTPRYTARDTWHDPELKRWYLLAYEARPDITPEQRLAMRAERLGVAVEDLAASRAQGLADLAAAAEASGLISATATDDGEPAIIGTTLRVGLPPDDRPAYLVCAMCGRTLHKEKGRREEVRPNTFTCRCCAGLLQDVPYEVIECWMLDNRPYKRAAIALTYRSDPATLTAAETSAEVTRLYEDAEGAPLAVEATRAMAGAQLVPVRTYFSLVRERGRGIL